MCRSMRRLLNWQAILRFVLTMAGLISLSACTLSKQDQYPDTVRVKLPWYSDGQYKLQVIELFTIENMVELKGLAARFVLSPSVENGRLVGLPPRIKTMRTSDGTYIPIDTFSTELVTLYAHFERLQSFDLQLGVDQMLPNWPKQQTIAVRADITEEGNRKKVDNALYSGELDAFLFVPYTIDQLPLSVNAGVIGHEYFHSLFYKLVLQPSGVRIPKQGQATGHDTKTMQRLVGVTGAETAARESSAEKPINIQLYHALLFRSLNEGLADVWGWLYSQDYQFVKRSNDQFARDLNQSDKISYSKDYVQGCAERFLKSDTDAYTISQMYSRRLYAATENALADSVVANKAEASQLVGKAILQMLIQLQTEFMAQSSAELLDPQRPLEILQDKLPDFKIVNEETVTP